MLLTAFLFSSNATKNDLWSTQLNAFSHEDDESPFFFKVGGDSVADRSVKHLAASVLRYLISDTCVMMMITSALADFTDVNCDLIVGKLQVFRNQR